MCSQGRNVKIVIAFNFNTEVEHIALWVIVFHRSCSHCARFLSGYFTHIETCVLKLQYTMQYFMICYYEPFSTLPSASSC